MQFWTSEIQETEEKDLPSTHFLCVNYEESRKKNTEAQCRVTKIGEVEKQRHDLDEEASARIMKLVTTT